MVRRSTLIILFVFLVIVERLPDRTRVAYSKASHGADEHRRACSFACYFAWLSEPTV